MEHLTGIYKLYQTLSLFSLRHSWIYFNLTKNIFKGFTLTDVLQNHKSLILIKLEPFYFIYKVFEMRIFFTRHGESENNVIENANPEGFYYLRVTDPEITALGQDQALVLKERYSKLDLDMGN